MTLTNDSQKKRTRRRVPKTLKTSQGVDDDTMPLSDFALAFKAYQKLTPSQKMRWKALCERIEADPHKKETILLMLNRN